MPRPKPSALTGTAELNAMIERVAPDVLGLLADGVPRQQARQRVSLPGEMHRRPGSRAAVLTCAHFGARGLARAPARPTARDLPRAGARASSRAGLTPVGLTALRLTA